MKSHQFSLVIIFFENSFRVSEEIVCSRKHSNNIPPGSLPKKRGCQEAGLDPVSWDDQGRVENYALTSCYGTWQFQVPSTYLITLFFSFSVVNQNHFFFFHKSVSATNLITPIILQLTGGRIKPRPHLRLELMIGPQNPDPHPLLVPILINSIQYRTSNPRNQQNRIKIRVSQGLLLLSQFQPKLNRLYQLLQHRHPQQLKIQWTPNHQLPSRPPKPSIKEVGLGLRRRGIGVW